MFEGKMLKRTFDIIAATTGLVIFLPILLIVAGIVLISLGRPILFSQTRPGKDAVPFKMYKFRTMLKSMDKEGNPLPDSERLTPIGRKLRSTSLDELPGLWNVIKGDVSLVGPRPLLMEYVERYSPRQARRMEIRPGITGWAQINGRNAISWERKFELDVWYVENRSFLLDVKIILKTVEKVVRRSNIAEEGNVTMSAFKGSRDT